MGHRILENALLLVFNLPNDIVAEQLCDCNAVEVMLSANISFQLGIFKNILSQSIAEGSANLWGITDQKAIKDRLIRITDKKGNITSIVCSGNAGRAASDR